MAETLSTIYFGLFILLLIIAAATTLGRIFAKVYWGVPIPKLLLRDAIVMPGLAGSFVLVLFARVLGSDIGATLRGNPAWITLTSIPALVALGVYVYFEIWVIGPPKRDKEEAVAQREAPVQEEQHGDV